MPLKQATLERQLQSAKENLGICVDALDKKGIAVKARRSDPKWRMLNSTCRQISARLKRAGEIVALDAELKVRKENKVVEKPHKEKGKRPSGSKVSKKEQKADAKAKAITDQKKSGSKQKKPTKGNAKGKSKK